MQYTSGCMFSGGISAVSNDTFGAVEFIDLGVSQVSVVVVCCSYQHFITQVCN